MSVILQGVDKQLGFDEVRELFLHSLAELLECISFVFDCLSSLCIIDKLAYLLGLLDLRNDFHFGTHLDELVDQ